MKKVESPFIVKLLGRILPVVLLATVCAAAFGNWSASASNRINAFFVYASGGSSVVEDQGTKLTDAPADSQAARPAKERTDSSDFLSSLSASPNASLLLLPEGSTTKAVVRRGFTLNGRIEGSVQQLSGENTIFNSGAILIGDLLVPGTPTLIRNGTSTFGSTVVGSGNAAPNNYSITLNSSSQLGRLLTRTNPVSMPTVAAPPAPTGTRNVTINNSTQSIGDFATLRNLTLNSNVGNKAIPPGTYGAFTANSGTGFILGTAGGTQPTVYNFSSLTLNGNTQLQVVGPVVITVGTGMALNGAMGSATNPAWLELKVAAGGVTLNSGSALYGSVTAPSATGGVTINSSSRLEGNVTAERLTVNSGGVLKIIQQGDTTPPVLNVQQPSNGLVTSASQITVSGTYSDESTTTIAVNGTAATINGNNFTATVSLNEGNNTLSAIATDIFGNQSQIIRSVTLDTAPPIISVSQPIDFTYTNSAQISIIGNFSGATAITVNSINAEISGNTFSKSIALNEGLNTIYIRAVDSAGNYSEIFHTITRDTSMPTISLTSPVQDQIAKTILIDGVVADISPVNVAIEGVLVDVVDGTFKRELNLGEGTHQVHINATDAAGNQINILRSVTIDLTQPIFNEVTPVSGSIVGASTTISGRITDAAPVIVKVNNITANVSLNGFFSIENVLIPEGENQLKIIATDVAGNENDYDIVLVGRDRTPPVMPTLFPVSSPTRLSIKTIEGTAEPGTIVIIIGGTDSVIAYAAYGSGLFAANVTLDTGINNFNIVAKDTDGNISPVVPLSITSNPNLELPPSGEAAQINISTGNAQKGLINTELPRPLITIVTDRTGVPVANVAVKFEIQAGGGRFVNSGAQFIQVTTDAQGYARATYISGSSQGIQQIRADFAGNTLTPAVFLNEALVSSGAETTVSGAILDQNLRALPNVLVRISGQQTRTGIDGRFTVRNIPSGPHQLLELIGRDQIQLPGRWTNITYDLDILPGVENTLRRPLFLPKVNEGINLPLDENSIVTQDTTFELPVVGGQPPIRVTAKAGTHVIFPPDVTNKKFSVTRIANNRIPMSLEDGRATNLYISVQPSGAVFETPLEISFPNLDLLPVNSEVLLMSFDHDAGRYVKVGTGHVSADGLSVKSDPGSGIRVGAWHALPPEPPAPEVTVLGHVQIEGNPSFEGKEIISEEAWVEGERAVLLTNLPDGGTGNLSMTGNSLTGNSPLSSVPRLDYRATLTVPRNSPPTSSRMESLIVAEKKLSIKIDSSDKRFAPGAERFNFKYSITPGETTTPQVAKFEVFKTGDLTTPIYSDTAIAITANKLDYSQGGTSGWDGKINQGTDNGKYIEPKNGPFTIRLTVASQTNYSDAVKSEKTFDVEIDSMDITPSKDFKSVKMNQTDVETDNPVDVTIKIKNKSGTGVVTPVPFKIKWSFEDPDDSASNTGIDQNGNGDDNVQVRSGGKRADSGGTAPSAAKIMWKTVNGFTATVATDGQSVEAEVATSGADHGKSKLTFSTSVIGGDNYFLFAKYLKDDGTVFKEKKSGKWSVWKNLTFNNIYRMNGGVDVSNVMSRDNINPAFNGDGYTDYTRGTVNNLTTGAQSPEFLYTIDPPTTAETPLGTDSPAQITVKAQDWFDRNRSRSDVALRTYINLINAPIHSIIGGRYLSDKVDSNTGTGTTNFYPNTIRINTSDPGTTATSVDPDGEWSFGIPGTAISERAFIFLNTRSPLESQVVGRHEVGHASDHVLFNLTHDPLGLGDHAQTGLMHPNGNPTTANPYGNPEFSPDSILRLRGVKP